MNPDSTARIRVSVPVDVSVDRLRDDRYTATILVPVSDHHANKSVVLPFALDEEGWPVLNSTGAGTDVLRDLLRNAIARMTP